MRLWRRSLGLVYAAIRSVRWTRSLTGARGWAAVAGAAVVLTLAGFAAAGIATGPGAGATASGPRSTGGDTPVAHQAAPAGDASPTVPAAAAARGSASPAAAGPTTTAAKATGAARAGTAARTVGLQTSCRSVAHIGDSTSVDLISSADLPDPAQQLPARYTGVGVRHLLMDASGGRSVVEALPGQVNGYNVAEAWWNQGYRGCWVFALGTNDTANVSVGSAVGLMGRINEMMSAAHGEPVVWVNTITQTSSGPWSEANQQLWDSTLVSALARYPNMRILNWAAVAQPGWFLPDGIHYNQAGCAARAQAIADGLARAFPRYGQSHGPIVG